MPCAPRRAARACDARVSPLTLVAREVAGVRTSKLDAGVQAGQRTVRAVRAYAPAFERGEMHMRARPHHLIDIITQFGGDVPFAPSDYGHAVHVVAEQAISDPDVAVEFVVGADDICAPCKHLVDGRCDDVLSQLDPPVSKQDYNDDLDRRLLAYLEMEEGQVMTFRRYLGVIRSHLDGIEQLCAHPGEDPVARLAKLTRGLDKLGA